MIGYLEGRATAAEISAFTKIKNNKVSKDDPSWKVILDFFE